MPLAETPLLVLVRKSNGSIDAASEINQMAGTPVTPYFALSSVNSGVTFRFKVTVVDKTTFTAADIFADGLKAAGGVGAHGWLISAISEPLVLSAVTTAQDRVSRYFSEQQATQISTRLDFNNPGQAASLVFQTSTNSSFGGKSEYKLSLKLVARPSLITEVTRPDNAGVPLVEGPAAPSLGTWAQNIPVAPKISLAASIENDGVPSKLTALQAGAASRQPLSVRDTIDAACTDLESALRGGKYFRLNETDADLVLYEQLHRAGVLQADFRNTVGCVTRLMSRWKERYRLAIPDVGVQPIDIPYPDMETRLKAFAGIWKNANPDVRAAGVTFNVIKPLPVEVDPQLFPSVAPSLVDTGRGTGAGSLNPAGLMETKMLCFGGWRKTDKNAASGMAQFDAATPYVVSLTFENMRPYDSNAGPQITSLLVRKATKEDLEKATGPSCLTQSGLVPLALPSRE